MQQIILKFLVRLGNEAAGRLPGWGIPWASEASGVGALRQSALEHRISATANFPRFVVLGVVLGVVGRGAIWTD